MRELEVLDEALLLPDSERQRLAEALLDSVPRQDTEEVESAWIAEAKRRAELSERGEGELIDTDSALDDLRDRVKRDRDK